MRVACFHLNQIGDLLFSLPALKSLKQWDPEGTLVSVARPSGCALLQRTALPDLVLARGGGWTLDKLRLVSRLRAERLDAAVLFSQSAECMAIAGLSGAPKRYGIRTPWLDMALTDGVECGRPPSTANDLRVLSLMGCPGTCTSYVGLIAPLEQDKAQAEKLLAENASGAYERVVAIAPGTSSRRSVKSWTVEGWRDVIDHIGARPGTVVVAVGTEDVSEITQGVRHPVVNLCCKTSLPVLLAILDKAELVIGVDSGILHLAAAAGSKVVGLYGMSDPRATGPQGEGHITISAGVDCSPCQLSERKIGRICMTRIDSGRVIEAVETVMASLPGRD